MFLIWCIASILSLIMIVLIVKHLYDIRKFKLRAREVLDSKDPKKAEELILEIIREL